MDNKTLRHLPVFYQNLEISEDESKIETKDKNGDRNFIDVSFYQTRLHRPELFYKPISKIWKLNEHE